MDKEDKRVLEELESDFHKVASKPAWDENDIEKMKNIQKLMYYMEVRCAMKEEQDYPGSEYIEGMMSRDSRSYDGRNSYARNMPSRNSMGRFTSGRNSYTSPYGYASGRRYYDKGGNSAEDIRHMMSMEQDPEVREALENALMMMENR